ncbi:type IV secretory system conjugative DNA transfer family protein [Cryptosporangium sp. NPDC051539]|uniref:type IV secretory system conjugative DNA transfer family protein n=1 Tax=Cryptosporangium sp. NPDC051539 TaxID=3363962 RepID=UPI00379991AC
MSKYVEPPKKQMSARAQIALTAVVAVVAGVLLVRMPAGTPGRAYWLWPVGFGVLVLGVMVLEWWPNRSAAQIRNWFRVAGLAAVLVGAGLRRAPEQLPGRVWWPALIAAGVTVLAGLVVAWQRRRAGSAGTVNRWSKRSRRNDGVASRWQLFWVASWFPVRRKATILRPSLRGLSWWRRWFLVPITELGTPLARVGGMRVVSPVEDVTLRVGGPRSGKSGELAGRILDAPGAVIATTTRTDLIDLTGDLRAQVGPVRVFNPSGLGGLKSTVAFDLLAGCEKPSVAAYRAEDLIAGASSGGEGDSGDREHWNAQAGRVLGILMHAAALGGADMPTVQDWVASPEAGKADILRFLLRSPEPGCEAAALQFIDTNDRTRSSITSTIMPALSWLIDETAAQAAFAGRDQIRGLDGLGAVAGFDVQELLDTRGTVYLLGAEDGRTAPLLAALTGHIAREARQIASYLPGGRLDPPLTLALDEAALICPIPLDKWTADMGGRNITIHIGVQSRPQLNQRWGKDGAAAIVNNSATVLLYGGMKESDDLESWSKLTGERDELVDTTDQNGQLQSRTTRKVAVMSVAQIAQLPFRRVVIIRRGMPPAVGRVQMAWKRRDVKAHQAAQRRARRTATLTRLADRVLSRWPDAVPAQRSAAHTGSPGGTAAAQPTTTPVAPGGDLA